MWTPAADNWMKFILKNSAKRDMLDFNSWTTFLTVWLFQLWCWIVAVKTKIMQNLFLSILLKIIVKFQKWFFFLLTSYCSHCSHHNGNKLCLHSFICNQNYQYQVTAKIDPLVKKKTISMVPITIWLACKTFFFTFWVSKNSGKHLPNGYLIKTIMLS